MDKAKDFEKGWEEYKAKKKQEIEEIYRIIDNRCALVNNCIECQFGKQNKFDCDKLCAATALYNADYRKIPEGVVVLKKEELQAHDKGLVDKFAESLKEKAHWFLNNEIQKDHFCECLDEICKEITGEK